MPPNTDKEPPIHHPIDDRRSRITRILENAFNPSHLELIDNSAAHRGHAGVPKDQDASDITHLTIKIAATCFLGQNRVQRHQSIYQLLGAEFESGLHALSLVFLNPQTLEPLK
jgi:BolA protein